MSGQGEKKQTGKGILVIGIIAIVVVAVLIGIIIFLVRSQNKPEKEEKRQVVVTEDNVDEAVKELMEHEETEKESVAPGYYNVAMETTWRFRSGDEASYDALVVNVEENTNDVYFDVVLASDEDQVLYRSPVIPRGGRLDDIKLDRKLDAGTYDTICIYHLVDENQNSLSQVRISLILIVEN